MNAPQTQEEREQELKSERIAEREIESSITSISTYEIMTNIENIRKMRKKKNPIYTQKYVAENAGMSLSAYKSHLPGNDEDSREKRVAKISAEAVASIKEVLRCEYTDIFKPLY